VEAVRPRSARGEEGSGAEEVNELKRRVAELETLVSKRGTAARRQRKTSARRKA
jgi:hypothetical protein